MSVLDFFKKHKKIKFNRNYTKLSNKPKLAKLIYCGYYHQNEHFDQYNYECIDGSMEYPNLTTDNDMLLIFQTEDKTCFCTLVSDTLDNAHYYSDVGRIFKVEIENE